MVKTLDDFFEVNDSRQILVTNLRTNIKVYCDLLTPEDEEDLLRCHLIMVRQCLEQHGVK